MQYSTFLPAAQLSSVGKLGMMGKGCSEPPHTVARYAVLFCCSSWTGGLFEGRGLEEVMSVPDGFGGHRGRVPVLQTWTWQSVAIAFVLWPPWAEAVATQELCWSCGLPHIHLSALSAPTSLLA